MRLSYLIPAFYLCFCQAIFAQTSIKLTNGEWEPFLSEFSYQYGVDSHVVTEAFKLEGIKVEWGFFPWKRSYQLAKNGDVWHGSAAWWPSEETKADFLVSDPISKTSFVFFHLKTFTFDWQSLSDLKGLRIGGTLEYDYGTEFMEAMNEKRINVELVSSDELNYKKLINDRIDIFPNDLLVGYSQIRNSLLPETAKKFTHHSLQFEKTTLHLILSKNNKNSKYFMDKFNSGLKKLKSSGRFSNMFKDLDKGKYDKQNVKWRPQND